MAILLFYCQHKWITKQSVGSVKLVDHCWVASLDPYINILKSTQDLSNVSSILKGSWQDLIHFQQRLNDNENWVRQPKKRVSLLNKTISVI